MLKRVDSMFEENTLKILEEHKKVLYYANQRSEF